MNIYEVSHLSACPNGGLMDRYHITLESPETVMVEQIKKALSEASDQIYQEDLATYLRNRLGVKTTVVGWHHGVKVTSIRD